MKPETKEKIKGALILIVMALIVYGTIIGVNKLDKKNTEKIQIEFISQLVNEIQKNPVTFTSNNQTAICLSPVQLQTALGGTTQ